MSQRTGNEFDREFKWRKLRVNAGKSKVMVFEMEREQIIDFEKPCRIRSGNSNKCNIWLSEEGKGNERI